VAGSIPALATELKDIGSRGAPDASSAGSIPASSTMRSRPPGG